MTFYLNPSLTLTEMGTIYLQAETKGLIKGTKKITFTSCDIDPITLTSAKFEQVLPYDDGHSILDLEQVIVNLCDPGCPVESYLLETSDGVAFESSQVDLLLKEISIDTQVS